MVTEDFPQPSNEPEPRPVRAFEALANNTGRALTYLVTALAPSPLAHSSTGDELMARQGPAPGWEFNAAERTLFPRACSRALETCGLVTLTTAKGASDKPVEAYKAIADAKDEGLAHAGISLDWELQFPQSRLADILGSARFGRSKQALPLTNFLIFRELLSTSHGWASYTELKERTDSERGSTTNALMFLVKTGSLERLNTSNLGDRDITLKPSKETYLKYYGGRMSPSLLALHATVQVLLAEGQTTIDLETLAARTMAAHPEISLHEIRYHFTHEPLPPFVAYAYDARRSDNHKGYHITLNHKRAIADLVLRMQLLHKNKKFAEAAASRAEEILDQPEDVASLMAKARPTKRWQSGPISEETQLRRSQQSLTAARRLEAILGVTPGEHRVTYHRQENQ